MNQNLPSLARPSIAALFAAGATAAAVTLAAMVALPHDPYVRWQDMRTEAFARLGWIYERLHDDPTPLDIALIGTSHTLNGLDGLAVAERIAARGVRATDGRCLTVTNLAMPAYGRNLHWVIARELLETRKPKAIVLEIFENETRKPHPIFSHVATSRDILTAPRLININYLADLIRLPQRQLRLAAESAAPAEFGLKARFDPRSYDGSTVDNTRVVNVAGQALTPRLDTVMDPAKLDAEAARIGRDKQLNMLPKPLEDYEYAVPRRYVRAILAAADRAGTPVYLLYLPGYGQPALPYDMRLYGSRPLLTETALLTRKAFWHDVNHLNAQGAALLSSRLGDQLAAMLRGREAGASGPCDLGKPARNRLRPFVHQ